MYEIPPGKDASHLEPQRLDLSEVETRLVEKGFRATRQRRVVFDALRRLGEHCSAERVYEEARAAMPRISLATVYKSLESLVEAGAAMRTTLASSASRVYEARIDEHFHASCSVCGRLYDVPARGEVRAALEREAGDVVAVERVEVLFLGQCPAHRAPGNVAAGRTSGGRPADVRGGC